MFTSTIQSEGKLSPQWLSGWSKNANKNLVSALSCKYELTFSSDCWWLLLCQALELLLQITVIGRCLPWWKWLIKLGNWSCEALPACFCFIDHITLTGVLGVYLSKWQKDRMQMFCWVRCPGPKRHRHSLILATKKPFILLNCSFYHLQNVPLQSAFVFPCYCHTGLSLFESPQTVLRIA